MKTKNIQYMCGLIIFSLLLNSCKKQIDVGAPVSKVVNTVVFSSDATATAAQLSIYAQFASNVDGGFVEFTHVTSGLSSDELESYATDQFSMDLYKNSLFASDAINLSFWLWSYNFIYQENAIIENLQQSTVVSPKVKKQLIGEAQFMRAYYYFYLVNLYGDVPLTTTSDYKINSVLAKTPKVQVYQQIIKDLIDAEGNLSSKYVDATDSVTTSNRIRPTVWAANALLARAYLYTGSGNYKQAEDQATAVINNTTEFSLLADLNSVFKANSPEAIWQIPPYSSNGGYLYPYTADGDIFILTSPPSADGNTLTLSTQQLNAFEPNDQRKANWVSSLNDGSTTYYFPYKYKDGAGSTVNTEYTMIFRLAEQYLIRAEARAQQGNNSGALTDLNTIRHRAGLPDYIGATDQASLVAAISHERQVELFTEGDRWINLKRTGTIDAVMGGHTGVTAAKGGVWNSYQQLYPIPLSDIQYDANLKQNPGY